VRYVVRGDYVTGTGRDRPRRRYEQRYEICVGGRLGDTIRSAFPELRARARGGDTVLSGVFADQAALYGVLAQIEALGLELIEVRRLPPA
jgi:hypothetical protein